MTDSERLEVRIAQRLEVAEDIVSLSLVPISCTRLPSFEAGSHIDVHVAPDLIRQYSLCNDPSDTTRYVIAVQREPDSRGGSATIHSAFFEGLAVNISRPRNTFKLVEEAEHSILVCGGIGITPMLAMAWRLHSIGNSFEMHCCTRSQRRTAFNGALKEFPFADRIFRHVDDGPDGQRFCVDACLATPGPSTHLYVCGPEGFMDFVTTAAKRLLWTEERIHLERFSAGRDVSGTAFTVCAARSGVTVTVPPGKTIAETLRAHNVAVSLSCEQGVCGTCLTPVVHGIPDHRDVYQTDEEKASNKQIALCCSRSRSARLVLDI
jgi:vanillate O-demethylase ferredoxin subunit